MRTERFIHKFLLGILSLNLCLAVFSVPIKAAPAITSADWPMYNQDVKGWRFNSAENSITPDNANQLVEKWRFPSEGSGEVVGVIHVTPSIVNGYVYFGTATHPTFYKLKPNGEVQWKYSVGDEKRQAYRESQNKIGLVPADGVYSSALVTNDSVYFADVLGIAYCLDRKTGEERWKLNCKAPGFPGAHTQNMIMSSPILADGKVIFGGGGYEHAAPLDPNYDCCTGRGFVIALDPKDGRIIWKYDLGPEPQKLDPPIVYEDGWGKHVFKYGPSTSSVWSTSSYDAESQTIFFGTDIHNSPKQPTLGDPRNYTEHSAAVVALNIKNGKERWISQTNPGDVWNHTMPGYDWKTGVYKDQSIGDTPKIYHIDLDGRSIKVVGVGSKNGAYYVMDAETGNILANTPPYTGPPTNTPEVNPRTLALPSAIGGIQTGCATDGKSVYTNGLDCVIRGNSKNKADEALGPPTGGKVVSISLDTASENWRHNRPVIPSMPSRDPKRGFKNVGDGVGSGIAIGNGLLFFTTLSSNQLVILDAAKGTVLKEIPIGPVFGGPSVSRGRVYSGSGNSLWINEWYEDYFPKRYSGTLFSFGLPGEDEIARMGEGNESVQ